MTTPSQPEDEPTGSTPDAAADPLPPTDSGVDDRTDAEREAAAEIGGE
jgi:hypothetical protein